MVSLPSDTDLITFDLLLWACAQGPYLNPTEMSVLYYLCLHAFVTKDNPEDAPLGQVRFRSSYYTDIMQGTGIKSENTVRTVLNSLQDKAYVHRRRRRGEGQRPLLITVMYDENCDAHREELREGKTELHPTLMLRPTARKRQPKLALVTPMETRSN